MPELPEVQTIINGLKKHVLKKKIKQVRVLLPKIIRGSKNKFIQVLKNNNFIDINRRGKFIIFSLKNKQFLIIHLRMTGQLIYIQQNEIIACGHSNQMNNFNLPHKQTHLIFSFQDQSQLFYNDQRQFGFLEIRGQKELKDLDNKWGIEPLSKKFTLIYLKKLLKNKRINIKAFLLNQKHIAGLGNIYTDESLFKAYILPTRQTDSLTEKEIKNLYQAIKQILKLALQYRGTTFNNYIDVHGRRGNFIQKLKVYGRENKKCLRCRQGIIKKIKVAGRGTHYCPQCQK